MRLMAVILNDFPEFLASYHIDFCSEIPIRLVQLRNIILSAHPKGMQILNPFTNMMFKADKLPEIDAFPEILSNYMEPIDAAGL
jgi:hypothetical protein